MSMYHHLFRHTIVQHLFAWLVYLLLWSARDLVFHNDYSDTVQTNLVSMLPGVVLVYFNLYWMIPRLLLRKKYVAYVGVFILGLAASSWMLSYVTYLLFADVYGIPSQGLWFISAEGLIVSLAEILVVLGFSMALYFLGEWSRRDRYAKELEKRNLETELALLKNQINPHFVFNTLNTIYHLMDQKVETAQEVLNQFSDTLSHQLYDTSKERIPLKNELNYLRNYLAIEQVRHEDMLTLDLDFPERVNGHQIAPMLLMPLVENAIKHGRSAQGCRIRLQLDVEGDTLLFHSENSIVQKRTNVGPAGGIGLQNVRRRLALIYPGRYSFHTRSADHTFFTDLKIELDEA